MNPHDQPPPEAALQAWVDERLPEADRRRVSDYLDANPAVAARLRRHREQNAALRAALRTRFPDAERPADVTLALARAAERARSAPPFGRVAALVGAVVLGAAAGGGGVAVWTRTTAAPAATVDAGLTLAGDAFLAHRTYTAEVRHFVEVTASEQHLLPWLSNRVGGQVVAPDLAAFGFQFIGGRVLPTPDGQAAQLMYEDADAARLTVYLRKDERAADTPFRSEERDGVSGVWWSDRGRGYALFAPLDPARLLAVAHRVQQQLDS